MKMLSNHRFWLFLGNSKRLQKRDVWRRDAMVVCRLHSEMPRKFCPIAKRDLKSQKETIKQESNSIVKEQPQTKKLTKDGDCSLKFNQNFTDRLSELIAEKEKYEEECMMVDVEPMMEDLIDLTEIPEEEKFSVYTSYDFTYEYDESLPVVRERENVIGMVESSVFTIISGATGSGKTTMVPQLLLDHYRSRGEFCNIFVCQPRRIAVTSVAKRVCSERRWELGTVVGYSIARDKKFSSDTRILYATTGILLEKLIGNTNFASNYTHIIIDEVHERSEEIDMCLLVLKMFYQEALRPVKLILMSATAELTKLSDFLKFESQGLKLSHSLVELEGRLFPTSVHYLEDVISMIHKQEEYHLDDTSFSFDKPYMLLQVTSIMVDLIISLDQFESDENNRGAALVFLPGLAEIEMAEKALEISRVEYQLILVRLHSQVPYDEQLQAFKKTPPKWRKVVLATNIAESSITVPDIKFVIDLCLQKQLECNKITGLTSLHMGWVSKSSADQRMGRAGRCSSGMCFRMVPKYFYSSFLNHIIAEIQRTSLEHVLLKLKKLNMGSPITLCQYLMDPPNEGDVLRALFTLNQIGAISLKYDPSQDCYDGPLTLLGNILCSLPLEIRIGKLIVLGFVFGYLAESIAISALLSMPSIFVQPRAKEFEVYRIKMQWAADAFSDSLTNLNVYLCWLVMRKRTYTDEERRTWARNNFLNLKNLKECDLLVEELCHTLSAFGLIPENFNVFTEIEKSRVLHSDNSRLTMKIIHAGAFYPYYFVSQNNSSIHKVKEMPDLNTALSVILKGFNPNMQDAHITAPEHICRMFQPCGKVVDVARHYSSVYITFEKPPKCKLPVASPVYMAIKLGRCLRGRLSDSFLPHYDPEYGRSGKFNNNYSTQAQRQPRSYDHPNHRASHHYPTSSIRGPYSPRELDFYGITKSYDSKITIDSQSVNCVCLHPSTTSPESYQNEEVMLVATGLTSNQAGSRVLVRHSVLMPQIKDLYVICVLLFCNRSVIRMDPTGSFLLDAICGLGFSIKDLDNPVSDSDINLSGPFENVTDEDIVKINFIRSKINFMLSSQESVRWSANVIKKMQQEIQMELLILLKRSMPVEKHQTELMRNDNETWRYDFRMHPIIWSSSFLSQKMSSQRQNASSCGIDEMKNGTSSSTNQFHPVCYIEPNPSMMDSILIQNPSNSFDIYPIHSDIIKYTPTSVSNTF